MGLVAGDGLGAARSSTPPVTTCARTSTSYGEVADGLGVDLGVLGEALDGGPADFRAR